ncbi:acyl-CoA thioesterase II [Kwoniella heveanensis BCC8398]|uniref:Acyl-CoA thioesterase II n=1 Tax=Kwoniella heveanensis BCC8398 TaxID=1296120 RepID=A0A1B9GNV5_9TREE|nr:acyl-CoA thioesterase II [Kwoniella heveanensis BCC8398]
MPPFASLSSLVDVRPLPSSLLTSSSSSKDNSISTSLWVPSGARGVFGGQVIAQSLSAASRTISRPLGLHSLHCYFLLPAHGSPDIEYRVERLRDGKSYANRLVRAWQGGREVFVLLASYTLPPVPLPVDLSKTSSAAAAPVSRGQSSASTSEEKTKVSHSLRFALQQTEENSSGSSGAATGGASDRNTTVTHQRQSPKCGFQPKFQVPFPTNLVPYEECEEEEHRWTNFLETKAKDWTGSKRRFLEEYIRERRESPVSIATARTTEGESPSYKEVDPEIQQTRLSWLRARLHPSEKPDVETIKAMIAYMTDFQFIGTASRSVGLHQGSTPRLGMLASLDHTIHFYPLPDDFDPSAPLLHVMESQAVDVASGRGVVQGRVYTSQGVLVAVTSQEGVVRADLKGLVAKGLVEGGAVGEEERDTAPVKAKL